MVESGEYVGHVEAADTFGGGSRQNTITKASKIEKALFIIILLSKYMSYLFLHRTEHNSFDEILLDKWIDENNGDRRYHRNGHS